MLVADGHDRARKMAGLLQHKRKLGSARKNLRMLKCIYSMSLSLPSNLNNYRLNLNQRSLIAASDTP